MTEAVKFTTPVGRLVGGSLYKPQDKDALDKPLTIKTGPNAGKPTVRYWLPVAIPKGNEAHWRETQWGALIWAEGVRAFPQAHQAPTFAWKIVDGDSKVPNKAGKTPSQNEGYPGNWVLNFGGQYAPTALDAKGTTVLTDAGAIKPGYYVQIGGSVSGNGQQTNPGVYLNYQFVALSGYGPVIEMRANPSEFGFGQAPLPPGASPTPVAGMPQAAAPAAAPAAPPSAPSPAPAPVVVTPHTAILTPPPPPAPAGPVMTAKAGGATYAQMIAAGWSDALLKEHGYVA